MSAASVFTSAPFAADTTTSAGKSRAPALGWWKRASFSVVHALATALLHGLSLRGLYKFGRFFGTLEWLVNFKRRRRFAETLRDVLGHEPTRRQRRRHTHEHFMQTRCDKLFYLVFDCIPREQTLELFTISKEAFLDEVAARGRGVYMALSHHGAQHVIALLMALRGFKVALVRDRREGALRRYVQRRFDRLYPEFRRMRVLFAGGYPRETYRCLKDGFFVGAALDVDRVPAPNQKTEEVLMFGRRRRLPTGPLRIAIRCRSPVLQAFVVPEKNFRYRLDIVGMLIDPDLVTDESAAVATAMRRYAANVEERVRAAPSIVSRLL